jgi:predicted transcriptional regulator
VEVTWVRCASVRREVADRLAAVWRRTYGVAHFGRPSSSAAGCQTLCRRLEIRKGVPEGVANISAGRVVTDENSDVHSQLFED